MFDLTEAVLSEVPTEEEFNKHIWSAERGAVNCTEPRIEKDGKHEYHCFDDEHGNKVGFISWRKGKPRYFVMHYDM